MINDDDYQIMTEVAWDFQYLQNQEIEIVQA